MKKNGKAKTFKIVDAGMNDLIRPALYQGYHEIIPVREYPSESCVTADVVGPICESGDFLAQNRDMPDVRQENSWPYYPPEPMVFHVFQLQFTAYGGRSPGGRGPMERHSQPSKLGRPHPGRIHSGITPPSRPSLECPSNDKTKEGHFLFNRTEWKTRQDFSSPPSHAELLSGDAARYCRTDSGGPVRPQVTMSRT